MTGRELPAVPEDHTLHEFEVELWRLRLQVLSMGGLVADQVSAAAGALIHHDAAAARLVVQREVRINAYDTDIVGRSFELLARRAPVASDLRTVIAFSRAVLDLERAGDEAKKIALWCLAEVEQRSGSRPEAVNGRIERLARLATSMIRVAVNALDLADATALQAVEPLDRQMDAEVGDGIGDLLASGAGGARLDLATLNTALVFRGLERVGDHAKNIAEHVEFLVNARDVRHVRPEP